MTKKEQPLKLKVLSHTQIEQLLAHLDHWQLQHVDESPRLVKKYQCQQFADAMLLANQIGNIAELEKHHPRLVIQWGWVQVSWWTYRQQGLTEMDFIMAARCDELAERSAG
ncbi:4a-hydroxytetrahydrobiopterin dehydratase [Celerinatantimonas yamalensis]|uniref:4a-hydroxytetrahydrobiopterin dehydratase n=1 Tax=Celerinatantimonas yamalensis TaxID=559956 RepID=A0ABW9G4R9_9GAMM